MKTHLSLIVLCLSIVGCAKYIPYQSTALYPRTVNSAFTTMTLIEWNADVSHPDFAVIAGVDSGISKKEYYAIIAPTLAYSSSKIDDVLLNYSVTVPVDDIQNIINQINNILPQWDKDYDPKNGSFYHFICETKMPVSQLLSPAVLAWVPSFDFTYNHTSRGSYVTVLLGDNSFDRRYGISDAKVLKSFQQSLKNVIVELHKKGMP